MTEPREERKPGTARKARRFFEETVLPYAKDDCLTWPFSRVTFGYGTLIFQGRQMLTSRAVCIATHGPPPSPEYHAAHSCGNGHLGCVNPRHIRWATPAENQADRARHGTETRGEKNPTAKLNDQKVRIIRQKRQGGATLASIAKDFGVCEQTVLNVCNGRRWSHVK